MKCKWHEHKQEKKMKVIQKERTKKKEKRIKTSTGGSFPYKTQIGKCLYAVTEYSKLFMVLFFRFLSSFKDDYVRTDNECNESKRRKRQEPGK